MTNFAFAYYLVSVLRKQLRLRDPDPGCGVIRNKFCTTSRHWSFVYHMCSKETAHWLAVYLRLNSHYKLRVIVFENNTSHNYYTRTDIIRVLFVSLINVFICICKI